MFDLSNWNRKKAKPVIYKGKEYLISGLVNLPETEVSHSQIRTNLNILRDLVDQGKAEMNDETILKCLQKKKSDPNKKSYGYEDYKKALKKKEEKLNSEKENWDLLNKIF